MIEGPASLPELEKYFEAPHTLTAESLANEFNLNYLICDSYESLSNKLQSFYAEKNKCSILEIKSNSINNVQMFKSFKNQL
jgi:2-succinyl-5-enolpyruvyl-6-hydroxy-3-cyclohexene-1-carboxylate synthase